MTTDRWNRIISYPRKYDLWIAAALTLFSAVCYSQTGPALDCRNKMANAFGTLYRPPESSTQELRLACNGRNFIPVMDGLLFANFEVVR